MNLREPLRERVRNLVDGSGFGPKAVEAATAAIMQAVEEERAVRKCDGIGCENQAELHVCYECADRRIENTIKARGLVSRDEAEAREAALAAALRALSSAVREMAADLKGNVAGCERLSDALIAADAALAAATEPKAGEYRCDSCGPDVPTRLCCNICGRPLEGPRIHGSLDERRKGG